MACPGCARTCLATTPPSTRRRAAFEKCSCSLYGCAIYIYAAAALLVRSWAASSTVCFPLGADLLSKARYANRRLPVRYEYLEVHLRVVFLEASKLFDPARAGRRRPSGGT